MQVVGGTLLEPVITIRSEINEATQPPEVSKQVLTALQPLITSLAAGYRIEMGGSIEEASKANAALAKIFPAMIAITLIVIMIQVRSFSTMAMVMLTAPLGLIGVVPVLLGVALTLPRCLRSGHIPWRWRPYRDKAQLQSSRAPKI